MSRHVLVINNEDDRKTAHKWVDAAPIRMRIEFKEQKRSLPQNDRMWAMLTDISRQATHQGRKYKPDQWKVIFMHACGREVQFLPSLDGSTFIPWGQSSSDLGVKEMTDLIEFMFAWGAENGVVFQDDRDPTEGLAG